MYMLQDKNYQFIDITTYQVKKNITIALKSREYNSKTNSFQMVTSVSNPYSYLETDSDTDILYVNEDYFVEKTENVLSDLENFIKRYSFNRLTISSTALIVQSLLMAIRCNHHIMFLTLGSSSDPYTLTKNTFDFLNVSPNLYEIDTASVEGEFEDQDKMYIAWFNKKHVCGFYNIVDLEKNTTFYFDYPIHDEEISYLKTYLSNGSHLYFNYPLYDNILKVIKNLKNKNITFYLPYTSDIMKYDEELLEFINNGINIIIKDVIDAKKMLEGEKILDLFVRDIKNSSLSSYRKYLAIYQLVKHFKTYQKNPKEKNNDSRDIYQILFNEFIVCEGYVNLLVKLLDKVGIKAMPISCILKKEKEVLTLRDEASLSRVEQQIKMGDEAYHSRLLVHLIDDDLDINGFYIADPTWDYEENSFCYVHLTAFETTLEETEFKKWDVDYLNLSSSEDFVNKVMNNQNAILFFKNMFYQLDIDFYTYLDRTYDLDNQDFPLQFYLDLYNYIITFTKNSIPYEKFNTSLSDVYKFIYVGMPDNKIEELTNGAKTFQERKVLDIVRR